MYAELICSLSHHCPRQHQRMSALSGTVAQKKENSFGLILRQICVLLSTLWNIQQSQQATGYGQLRFPWRRGTSVRTCSLSPCPFPMAGWGDMPSIPPKLDVPVTHPTQTTATDKSMSSHPGSGKHSRKQENTIRSYNVTHWASDSSVL